MPRPRNTAFWATAPFRKLTAARRKTADIVICGAQKSGTTYLAELLASQPGFYEPPIKEVFFFNAHWQRGTAWYASHFQLQSSDALQIDASPAYMIHPAVPARIREVNPEARLVFILRDPVARAYSHYQHNRRAGLEDLDFADALAAEESRIAADLEAMEADPDVVGVDFALYSYRTRGTYARYLRRFYEEFQPASILVLDSERVFNHDPTEMGLLEAFVGRTIELDSTKRLSTNAGKYAREPSETDRELRAFYEPWDAELVELTGRQFSWTEPGGS
ncbi:sulfotransferase family protein [Nocardioides antri]|nr:sulfotransferase [Nocardioides antri]